MNENKIKGQWEQMKGKVKEKWGELTDDDLTAIDGRSDQLAGRIQERYGMAQEEAEREVRAFESSLGNHPVDRGL